MAYLLRLLRQDAEVAGKVCVENVEYFLVLLGYKRVLAVPNSLFSNERTSIVQLSFPLLQVVLQVDDYPAILFELQGFFNEE